MSFSQKMCFNKITILYKNVDFAKMFHTIPETGIVVCDWSYNLPNSSCGLASPAKLYPPRSTTVTVTWREKQQNTSAFQNQTFSEHFSHKKSKYLYFLFQLRFLNKYYFQRTLFL